MIALHNRDFASAGGDPDCSRQVVQIYRVQFPELYTAVDAGKLRTRAGSALQLGGDTLITYNGAIRRIFGKRWSEPGIRRAIRRTLECFSTTSQKRIECWDEHKDAVVNNHQIGNMMPFPSGNRSLGDPSLNSLRFSQHLDYFDRFLIEVEQYYETCSSYQANSAMQKAIYHYCSYFDFFESYERFITENLLQDFVGRDLWSITDFEEYVAVANKIIDGRGRRFTVTATFS